MEVAGAKVAAAIDTIVAAADRPNAGVMREAVVGGEGEVAFEGGDGGAVVAQS